MDNRGGPQWALPLPTQGFTVVELIVVLLLLGVLSVTALSRISGPSAFAPRALSSTTMAQAHHAALSAQTRSAPVSLQIFALAQDWMIDVRSGGASLRSSLIERANTRVEVANAGNVFTVDATDALNLMFTGDGQVNAGTVGANLLNPDVGVELRVIGDSVQTLCIYPTGYTSARIC